jgi:hypothetical protein
VVAGAVLDETARRSLLVALVELLAPRGRLVAENLLLRRQLVIL